jgi:hypothetical protein
LEKYIPATKNAYGTYGKSLPNGLSCSVQVSNSGEALIYPATTPISLNPLPLRFFLVLLFRRFTIWVPPVFGFS